MWGKEKNQTETPDVKADAPAVEKTTPDEGKRFDKPTEFVCVQDCVYNARRRHKGEVVVADKCPPWFIVKPKEKKEEE